MKSIFNQKLATAVTGTLQRSLIPSTNPIRRVLTLNYFVITNILPNFVT